MELQPSSYAEEQPKIVGDYSTQIIQEKPQPAVYSLIHLAHENSPTDNRIRHKSSTLSTFEGPEKSMAFVQHDGVYELNFCDICNKMGHLDKLCPLSRMLYGQ
ncbi:hypothetical protein ACLB2K_008901 [Fragaria x ananassa]